MLVDQLPHRFCGYDLVFIPATPETEFAPWFPLAGSPRPRLKHVGASRTPGRRQDVLAQKLDPQHAFISPGIPDRLDRHVVFGSELPRRDNAVVGLGVEDDILEEELGLAVALRELQHYLVEYVGVIRRVVCGILV